MKRVLTSLGMILVLLLTFSVSSFVSNAYQKAAGYFLTSDLGTKIRGRVEQQELGRAPCLDDLLCRFSREELDLVWDSVIWIYPDLCKGSRADDKLIETEVLA